MTIFSDISAMAPPWIPNMIWKIVSHPGAPWFFLGTGIEALGITVQYQYFEASYPILDFIVGFGLFAYLVWWQRENIGGDDENVEGDADEEETGAENEG